MVRTAIRREEAVKAVKNWANLTALRAIIPCDSPYQQEVKSTQLQPKGNASLFLLVPLICPGWWEERRDNAFLLQQGGWTR